MALEELYREVILDHYRSPRNREPLSTPEVTAEGVNPLCGDEVTIELDFDEQRIAAISNAAVQEPVSSASPPIRAESSS